MSMLDLIRHTKVYQEAYEEGKLQSKLEIVPLLLELGLSVQEVAVSLQLEATNLSRDRKPSPP